MVSEVMFIDHVPGSIIKCNGECLSKTSCYDCMDMSRTGDALFIQNHFYNLEKTYPDDDNRTVDLIISKETFDMINKE